MPQLRIQPELKADALWPKWASNFCFHKPHETVEHIFQAQKTLDQAWSERILKVGSPSEAKLLGRQAPLRPDWEDVKLRIMYECLLKKFDIPEYHLLLMSHRGPLAEMNSWHDNYWGICTCVWCGSKGLNMLGQLLMHIRMGRLLP